MSTIRTWLRARHPRRARFGAFWARCLISAVWMATNASHDSPRTWLLNTNAATKICALVAVFLFLKHQDRRTKIVQLRLDH